MKNWLKRRIITEKTVQALQLGKYVFSVDIRLTKTQIKKLFEDYFQVEIGSVNTHIKPGKRKQAGLKKVYKPGTKQAIITLKNKGQRVPGLNF